MSVVTERCKTCFYFCNCDGHYIYPTCDYIILTGHRRGCLAGDECDKYLPSEDCLTFTNAALGRVKLPVKQQLLVDLYEQGLNDSEIGRAAGISRSTVAVWRNKHGLPSNYLRERTENDED